MGEGFDYIILLVKCEYVSESSDIYHKRQCRGGAVHNTTVHTRGMNIYGQYRPHYN